MHIAYHHILKRKKKTPKKELSGLNIKNLMDKSVYVFTFFGVCANVPQLTRIWIDKEVEGVSIITWIGFFLGSFFWLCYGIVHREKPIIIANSLYVVIQLLIVLGLVLAHVPFTVI